MPSRPQFARISDAMKQWSALLGAEVASWPSVASRRMFGMTVYYRGKTIFAALPRTRAFETPQSVAFKVYRKTPRIQNMLEADPRIRSPLKDEGRWIRFELESEKDLAEALKWFDLAYRTCVAGSHPKK